MGLIADKYFSESIESPSYREHLEAIEITLPDIIGEGEYSCSGKSLVGDINPVVRVLKGFEESSPTIIHHHGINEKTIDRSCSKIFLNKKYPIYANIILVQSPFRTTDKEFSQHMNRLSDFIAMITSSVKITELLVKRHVKQSSSPVIVTGMDLGGFVANLHHAIYNTASVYIPILAGAGLGDMMINSAFKKNIASEAKNSGDRIVNKLNFDDLFMSRGSHANVFPLLSKSDQVFRFERQRTCFGDIPLKVVNKCPLTGFSTGKDAAGHVIRVMERATRLRI